MATRIGINGFGRIGRSVFRILADRDDIQVIAVNDLFDNEQLAYLLKYDTVMGVLHKDVSVEGDSMFVDGQEVAMIDETDPAKLPWKDLGVGIVIEATGVFRDRESLEKHLEAGAKKVILTVPPKDAIDATIVLGVNDEDLKPEHRIVSNASCTTNCLAPLVKILDDSFGLEEGFLTTVHAYTMSQGIIDRAAGKKHRGRAAAVSIIPSTTGADKATVKVLPALAGKIRANAIRVPVPDGSITDITALLTRPASADAVNALMQQAAAGRLKGIVGYSEEELVSVDILGEPYSGIVHANATQATGSLVKLQVWYDNEIGYAHRCLDAVSNLGM